jgi:hypothetical protein
LVFVWFILQLVVLRNENKFLVLKYSGFVVFIIANFKEMEWRDDKILESLRI